jgi:hypothetical protein
VQNDRKIEDIIKKVNLGSQAKKLPGFTSFCVIMYKGRFEPI